MALGAMAWAGWIGGKVRRGEARKKQVTIVKMGGDEGVDNGLVRKGQLLGI